MTEQEIKPFFHKLTKAQIKGLAKNKITWGQVMADYRQPEWCGYPDALEGIMGCWSLTDLDYRTRISREYCKTCDLYIEAPAQASAQAIAKLLEGKADGA